MSLALRCGEYGEIRAAYEPPCAPSDERLHKAVKCHKSKERCSEPEEALNKSPLRFPFARLG